MRIKISISSGLTQNATMTIRTLLEKLLSLAGVDKFRGGQGEVDGGGGQSEIL